MVKNSITKIIFFVPSIALGVVILLELMFRISLNQKIIIYGIIIIPITIFRIVLEIKESKKRKDLIKKA